MFGFSVAQDTEREALVQLLNPLEFNRQSRQMSSHSASKRASEIILLATPWPATQQALQSAGDLFGKVLIDATNPLLSDLSGLEIGTTTSGAEQVAAWAPGTSRKGFNTVGFGIMADPTFGNRKLFYCGDDGEAKQILARLATELGFDPADAGPLSQARLLEPFALLWISLALKYGFGRDIAFQFMRER
jgi:hypothetical protein